MNSDCHYETNDRSYINIEHNSNYIAQADCSIANTETERKTQSMNVSL